MEIRDERSAAVGWLIGDAISAEGEFLHAPVSLAATDAAAVPAWLNGLGGRFVCVLAAGAEPAVYLDAGGGLGVVYSARDRLLASTLTLLTAAASSGKEIFRQSITAFPSEKPNQFIPGGLTAHPGIRRLLPNHHLDLIHWQAVRHWPCREIARVSERDTDGPLEEIAAALRQTILATARRGPIFCGLTAGRDSRMLLACARDAVDDCAFFTFDYRATHGPQRDHAIDLHIAEELARRFGLRHRILHPRPAPESLKNDYLLRIGYAGNWGKAQDFYEACAQQADLRATLLCGFAGEVGRGYYWHDGDDRSHLTAPELLQRMIGMAPPALCPALEEWMAGLPFVDHHLLLDLLYLEHRLGTWAGPHLYGAASFRRKIVPLADPRIFRAMLSLPVEFRRQQRMAHGVIERQWPELLAVPFQDFSGLSRVADRLASAGARARSFARRVRRKIGV